MQTPSLKKWIAEPNPHYQRRLGKTLEELGELTAVVARATIQGLDAIDPASEKTNRQRLLEETADVYAQLACNIIAMQLDEHFLNARMSQKIAQMLEWEQMFN